MWRTDIEREAGVVAPNTPEWSRRFRLWQDTGESTAGAARMLKMMVRNEKLEAASCESQMHRAICGVRRGKRQ
jgi:hypothetical protein